MTRFLSIADQTEKLEKRRMGLMVLTIAVAAYIGSQAIAESGVPLIVLIGPEVFGQL